MIYIIDDDKYVVRAYELLLKSADYPYKAYLSVVDFMKDSKPKTSDLLLLDMHMVELNGYDLLAHHIKNNFKMGVVVITAYDTEELRSYAHNYGVLAYLRKPIDGEALLDIIKYNYKA